MRYKLLGKSGLRVSQLCLGTMTFGEDWGWGSSEGESRKVFDTFVESGGNFFDTANIYTNGSSERLLGKFLGQNRDKHVVATKYTLSTDPKDPNASGNNRKNLYRSVEESLKRLNTDYIDLLWIHAWDGVTPVEEVMRALDDMVRSGKVHYVGVSDTPAWVVAQANTTAHFRGWTPFTALQLEYNLLERTIEREYFGLAHEFDIAITPWGPLAMGLLSGKYSGGKKEEGRFSTEKQWSTRYHTDFNMEVAERLVKLAQDWGRTPSQIALRWMMEKSPVVIPILGARTEAQLKDNLGVLDFSLNAEQMQQLDDLNPLDKGFPHQFLESESVRSLLFGNYATAVDNHRKVRQTTKV